MKRIAGSALILVVFTLGPASAQAPASKSFIGTVTAFKPDTQVEIKPDNAPAVDLKLTADTIAQRVVPGEKTLKNAVPASVTELAIGDRVLVTLEPDNSNVRRIIIMSATDIGKRDEADRQDWNTRGISGIVAAKNGNTITLRIRSLQGETRPTITVSDQTKFRRYAPDSVKFVDAKKSSLAEIKAGDQVRARGTKSDDGGKLTADEIVSGSFRMLAGLVLSIDAQENQVRINNLETKKPMVVKVNPDSSVHKLPPPVAQMLAARLHGGQPGADGAGRAGAGEGAGGGRGQGASEQNAGASPAGGRDSAGGGMGRGTGGGRGGGRGGDVQSLIERAPSITLADLKNGDAIIVSSTVGASADQVTAITVLAGVEPILTKPGTREMSLGQWNMDVGDMGQP